MSGPAIHSVMTGQKRAALLSIAELCWRGNRSENISYRAFTLIELLVVIGIIGILAAIGLPAMKGIGQANVTTAANRQMLDDLAFARLRAISDRTTVYVVFTPTNIAKLLASGQIRPEDRRVASNLVSRVYASYALLSLRSVGDQPGQFTPRYLSEWKTLPDGILIPQAKFARDLSAPRAFGSVFNYAKLPFPKARSSLATVPCIAFNSQGQVLTGRDEFVPLVRGTIFFPRLSNGQIDLQQAPDVQFIPPKLGSNDFQVVHLNWLTGRGRVVGPEFRQ